MPPGDRRAYLLRLHQLAPTLDALAQRYGTDPWNVYHWSLGRLDFNLAVARRAAEEEHIRDELRRLNEGRR